MRFNGARLKELRTGRSWDQHRLAEAARSHGVGITQSQISRYENGKEPAGRNVVALAAALGVQPRDLYENDEDAEVASMAAGGPLMEALTAALREVVKSVLAEATGTFPTGAGRHPVASSSAPFHAQAPTVAAPRPDGRYPEVAGSKP